MSFFNQAAKLRSQLKINTNLAYLYTLYALLCVVIFGISLYILFLQSR